MATPILETRSISKRYPGVLALSDVNFNLLEGEVHSLCGENGAGKSTLIKVLGGVLAKSSYDGELWVRGAPVVFSSIRDAEAAGIAVIHQELALVDEMTVAENVFLGNEPQHFGFVNHGRMFDDTLGLLARVSLDIDPAARVRDLGMGQKQLVEIARALAKNARILILDEPTSALTEREVATLLAIIKDLRHSGVSCIYISHKLDEVFELSDRITVLRDGKTVFVSGKAETDEASIVEHMVGRRLDELFPPSQSRSGEVLLSVEGLSVAPRRGAPARLRDISFELRGGEVLGIGGLMGAGRSELASVWLLRRARGRQRAFPRQTARREQPDQQRERWHRAGHGRSQALRALPRRERRLQPIALGAAGALLGWVYRRRPRARKKPRDAALPVGQGCLAGGEGRHALGG
jgi:D-xylose transport system ATP-binding protein